MVIFVHDFSYFMSSKVFHDLDPGDRIQFFLIQTPDLNPDPMHGFGSAPPPES